MASYQCHKPCEDKSHHAHHGSSLGQKVTGLFKGNHNNHSYDHEGTKTHTEYYNQTEVFSQSGHVAKSGTKNCSSQTRTNTDGRTKREHKRNFLQKVRDGISGHSSDDNCSSESDSGSDSDNDNCRRRKNCN